MLQHLLTRTKRTMPSEPEAKTMPLTSTPPTQSQVYSDPLLSEAFSTSAQDAHSLASASASTQLEAPVEVRPVAPTRVPLSASPANPGEAGIQLRFANGDGYGRYGECGWRNWV
jgi:hypothetical protein